MNFSWKLLLVCLVVIIGITVLFAAKQKTNQMPLNYVEATNSHEIESFPGIINRTLTIEEHQKAMREATIEMEAQRRVHICVFDEGTKCPYGIALTNEQKKAIMDKTKKEVEEEMANPTPYTAHSESNYANDIRMLIEQIDRDAEVVRSKGYYLLNLKGKETDELGGVNLLFMSMQMRLAMIQLKKEQQ